ncbi:YidH family protein [Tsukamurella ocularis]|uniref:YidH family protein n=1 Tax=Tsukamurella ocularis TaxID=1970234 RepID=UPI0039EEC340
MTATVRPPGPVVPQGEEPDPRFTLANERTFLAWTRTSLAVIAAALGLEALAGDLVPDLQRGLIVRGSLILAIILAVQAGYRWRKVDHAMRHGRPLPRPGASWWVIGYLVIAALVLLFSLP